VWACDDNCLGIASDALLSLACFTVFGALVNYVNGTHCKTILGPEWFPNISKNSCKMWDTVEAFAFIDAVLFGVNAFWSALGPKHIPTHRKESQPASETSGVQGV
jgi:hypothetical protein